MSDLAGTFGARYAALGSVEDRLALDLAEDRRRQFVHADAALDTIIAAAFDGERVAAIVQAKRKSDVDRVEVSVPLSAEERQALGERFDVSAHERRGSWYLPDGEELSLGLIHVAHWARRNPRLLLNIAESERVRTGLRSTPDAVVVWALEPLFEDLFLPLKLHGSTWIGKRTIDQQEKTWAAIDPLYHALRLAGSELDAFRVGTGWSRHAVGDIVEARRALVERWSTVAEDAGALYRTFRVGELVDRYYAKAKNGRALRRSIITKPVERTLTAYFGGSWLDFLAYLGEEVDPAEEIVQTLPEPRLIVGGSARISEVAAAQGLPEAEIEKVLAAFWQQQESRSPIEQRIELLKRYWQAFDRLHAAQTSGMPPLRGLVQEHSYVSTHLGDLDRQAEQRNERDTSDEAPVAPRLYERLLPGELNADVERLWATIMLPRWPDRLVTEPDPHLRLFEAFGPALQFWHEAALDLWNLCEGPSSYTANLDNLPNQYHYELGALKKLGLPVPGEFFSELREAKARCGKPRYDRGETAALASITISAAVLLGRPDERNDAPHVSFDQLRDIMTRHRRAWAEQHLDAYLRSRWEQDLRAIAEQYYRTLADRAKPPTVKQFAKPAAPIANRWFGGDLTGVYAALGLRSPSAPVRATRLVPRDANTFATRLYERLSGAAYAPPPPWKDNPRGNRRHYELTYLAEMCVDFLQIQEASGGPPNLAAFRQRFTERCGALAGDPESAWIIYSNAVSDLVSDHAQQRADPPREP